ncbi:hypothetical protein BH11MYX2_BH11MYX2_30880 [soil metagenome]
MKRLLAICLFVGVAHAEPAGIAQPEEPTSHQSSMQPIGEGVHIQPIVISQDAPKSKDLRPIYMGVGLLLIAAAFWFNRRQREKFDRSDVVGGATTDSEPTVTKTDEDKA